MPQELFQLLGRASQLLSWERDHRFCGRCAGAMSRKENEYVMVCSSCEFQCYPRIAPCAIMLVTRGEDVLLARSAQFPDGFYSALAGFVEPGESAEECLIREVKEEVGLVVGNPRYFGSQPWAFPSQLMLGYFCDYESGDIACQEDEILDAKWFRANSLPAVPPESAIAGQLIRHYFKHYTG
ncbi:MAG: NAD(+) diphosphatase [Gammaproteobacteria bacterium]|nr:MAG: NAD(+) diphosphatase [Gammaproteobacteria bacterium]